MEDPEGKSFDFNQLAVVDNSMDASDNSSEEESVNQTASKLAVGNQWLPEEKKLFIKLLKKHGRNFPAIASDLPRRSVEQCRNYF